MWKLQAHICNINFIFYSVKFDLSGRTFPAGCSWSQDIVRREGRTGIRGGFSVKSSRSTCYLPIHCSHETEGEGAKFSWQQDEFHVMEPVGLESGSCEHTQFNWALSDFRLGVKWVSSRRSQWEGKGQQPLLPVMDPCEGAQLGAAETLEALHPAPCSTLGCRCPGLAWEDQWRVWGEGQRWTLSTWCGAETGSSKAAPLHWTWGQGDTGGISPV